MLGLGLSVPSFAAIKRAIAQLSIIQAAPFFFDTFDSTNTQLATRTGWTPAGDATQRVKMKSADNMARMNTGTNGSPYGFALTPDPSATNRRITIGYDYSQQGGTLSNSSTPYQWYDQVWILAYQDTNNYTYMSPVTFSGGVVEMRIYKYVAGVATEMFRYAALPLAGTLVLELTDRVRCFVNGLLRVPVMLYTDARNVHPDRLWTTSTTDAIRTGPAALRHTFHPLILALDLKVETLDITVADPKTFYGRDATNKRNITFTGTYNGTPVAWCYRLRRRTTGATVKDWTAISPTAAAGSWSVSIDIPTGGPFLADFGWTGADGKTRVATSNYFAVGELIVCWGQSNANNQAGVGGTVGYGGNDLIIGFNSNSAYAGTTSRRWMDELTPESRAYQPNMVGLAKSLSDKIGIPVGVAAVGVTAQDITTLMPGTTYYNTVLTPLITELGGNVRHWVWSQGEAEVLSLSAYNTYAANFATLIAGLRSLGGFSDAMIFLRTIGKDTSITNDSTRTTRSQAARSVMAALENGTDVWVGCHSLGLALSDSIHFTSADSVTWAYRMGMSIARRAYAALAYDGRGPIVSGASRSGAVITLTLNLNGATGISGSALTGYAVSNDDFATVLTVNSTEVSSNQIVITLASTPTGTVKVRSFREQNYTDSSLAVGAYATEGITIPVAPIVDPITVT